MRRGGGKICLDNTPTGMKLYSLLLASIFLLTSPTRTPQDPIPPKRDNLYIEFITNCNWEILGLEGKFKLHPQRTEAVGFRAWTPYLSHSDVTAFGLWAWTNVNFSQGIRDCIIFPWSSMKIEYPYPPGSMPVKWDFLVYYDESTGIGIPNSETHMRVWGPCELVRLSHGEAMIKHGDKTFYVKVDENDYVNYPPWEISLR